MKLKTIKTHENDYGVRDGLPYEKSNGRIYDVDDEAAAQALIDAGYAEKVNGASAGGGSSGSGAGAKRAS